MIPPRDISYIHDGSSEPHQYEEAISFFWDIETRRFLDEDCYIVHNIYEAITPSQFLLFLDAQANMVFPHREWPEVVVELFWPDEGIDIPEENWIYAPLRRKEDAFFE